MKSGKRGGEEEQLCRVLRLEQRNTRHQSIQSFGHPRSNHRDDKPFRSNLLRFSTCQVEDNIKIEMIIQNINREMKGKWKCIHTMTRFLVCYIRIHDTYSAGWMEWSNERNLNNNIENSLIVLFWGSSHFIFQQQNIILIRDSYTYWRRE